MASPISMGYIIHMKRGTITLHLLAFVRDNPGCRAADIRRALASFQGYTGPMTGWGCYWTRHLYNIGYVRSINPSWRQYTEANPAPSFTSPVAQPKADAVWNEAVELAQAAPKDARGRVADPIIRNRIAMLRLAERRLMTETAESLLWRREGRRQCRKLFVLTEKGLARLSARVAD